ncbi:ATP-binding cassette domain-containing protein [Mucilaginibacter sp. McL0603]|uniref:ATP-binding cassette domain-containing protein n=1 Tax=Mucilaginibacter sp. McL0603 TaxID=3415670 RepID=UPI003CF80790
MQFLSGILNILDQKERVRLFLLIFLDVLISGLDIAFLAFTILVVNFYIKGASLPYSSWLPQSLANKDSVLLILIFFILFGIKNILAYVISSVRYSFIYKVASRLSEQGIRQYFKSDYFQFVQVDSSVHIRKINQQPIEFSHYILTNFQQIISQSVLVMFTIAAILFYHATLFLLLFVLLMPAVILLGWLLKRQLKHVRQHIKKTNADTLKTLNEALAGYIESNVYGKDDFFAERYHKQQQQMNQQICKQQSLQYLPSRLIEIFAILGFLILIVVNKWATHTPVVDLLTIGVFVAAAYKIIPGMVRILNSAGQMKTYEFTLDDLLANKEVATAIDKSTDYIRSINFENICFKYKNKPVLKNINFEINPGDFVGVSANSGRGKTTLMHILLGFIEQDGGIVCINNKVKTAVERKDYRNRISYIKQQPFFIHDTVVNNIILQEEGYDDSRLTEIISFCGLDIILNQYPEGRELIITENGKNLSGGQRQRIMLARALYHDFDLLILDEPFSEMDEASENDILSHLQLLAGRGKMIIFITHNKAGLSFCNKIISLDD